MALRNRKQQEASKILGVNLIDEPTDIELGGFTRLANFVQADTYSIKKKRGPMALGCNALNNIMTEEGDYLTTEDGDPLITEL